MKDTAVFRASCTGVPPPFAVSPLTNTWVLSTLTICDCKTVLLKQPDYHVVECYVLSALAGLFGMRSAAAGCFSSRCDIELTPVTEARPCDRSSQRPVALRPALVFAACRAAAYAPKSRAPAAPVHCCSHTRADEPDEPADAQTSAS